MNRKGFTLIELIATLVILGIVVGIVVVSVSDIFSNAKNKTEDVFVGTIKDAMDIYLTSSNVRELNFDDVCSNSLNKTHGSVNVSFSVITFSSVITSEYRPITQSDLVNPANEEVCNNASDITVNIYKDSDYVYYYSVDKSEFGCLKSTGLITNLPEGFDC